MFRHRFEVSWLRVSRSCEEALVSNIAEEHLTHVWSIFVPLHSEHWVTEAGTVVQCVPRVVGEADVEARPGFTIDKHCCLVISAVGKNLSFLRPLHDVFDP
jgi:hypothetical protein